MHTFHRLLIEKRIFSAAYYYDAFETGGHVVKHYIFHLPKARRFTD